MVDRTGPDRYGRAEEVGEPDSRNADAGVARDDAGPLAAPCVVPAVPAVELAAGEVAAGEAGPGEDVRSRRGDLRDLGLAHRETAGPRRRDHLGEREVVAEDRELAGIRPERRAQRPEPLDRPVGDAEARDRPALDLAEKSGSPLLHVERRVVPVEHERVEDVDAERRAGELDLRRDERRRAGRRVASLGVEDELVSRAGGV